VTAPVGASCSGGFEFEPLTDELHGFGQRGDAESEGALHEARLTANIAGDVENCRLAFAERAHYLEAFDRRIVLQPDFGRSTSFPMAFPGPLLVPAAPARPGAGSRMVRRSAPDQVPQQAAHFRHGERQQIGLEIECAFFPLRLCSEARQDRRGPASPA
jgi:hypothetical protein